MLRKYSNQGRNRLGKVQELLLMLTMKVLFPRMKGRSHKAFVRTVMLYGSETQVLNVKDLRYNVCVCV